ncbi:DNA-binding protein [Nonomuraea sp. NPDC004297]
MTRSPATPGGTLVLDSEGLAKAVLRDRTITTWLALARADDLRVVTPAATLVEVVHPYVNRPALEWTLSRLVIEAITEQIARHAAPGPATILTSDPEDLAALCGPRVTVIKV